MSKSLYDPLVPKSLKQTQEWFASVISMPLIDFNTLRERSTRGESVEEEAKQYIASSTTLEPYQRLELYSQQYWWRLVRVMQETFSTLVNYLGYGDFNQKIAIPYINQCPSTSWSLNRLGDTLSDWILAKIPEGKLLSELAKIDFAFMEIYLEKETIPLLESGFSEEDLLVKPLFLRPTVRLFSLDADYFLIRNSILAGQEFEVVESPFFYVVYRMKDYKCTWQRVTKEEWMLLNYFTSMHTVEEVSLFIENQGEELLQAATANLSDWFAKWVRLNWMTFHG